MDYKRVLENLLLTIDKELLIYAKQHCLQMTNSSKLNAVGMKEQDLLSV